MHFIPGVGIDNNPNAGGSATAGAGSESLVRRAAGAAQDPVFQKMKSEFGSNFDFTAPGANKLQVLHIIGHTHCAAKVTERNPLLQNLIQKLKKWIKILEAKTRSLPKSFLIEERCRFLSNFSRQTAEVELPGELLLPKHSHYQVRKQSTEKSSHPTLDLPQCVT